LLAPEEGITAWLAGEAFPSERDAGERTAALLSRYFRVSLPVILIQLSYLGLISNSTKTALQGSSGADLAQRYGWGPAYEQEQEAAKAIRAPRRILERAVEAYRQNLIGVKALAMLEGRKAEEAEAALSEAGIVPRRTAQRVDVSRLITRGRAQGQAN
jgi:hypothetical protein